MKNNDVFWRIKKAIGKLVGVPPQCVLGWHLETYVPNEREMSGLMQNRLRVALSTCPSDSVLEGAAGFQSCTQKDTFSYREWDVSLVLLAGSRDGKATRRVFKAVADTVWLG
jgi:hypothetical protein